MWWRKRKRHLRLLETIAATVITIMTDTERTPLLGPMTLEHLYLCTKYGAVDDLLFTGPVRLTIGPKDRPAQPFNPFDLNGLPDYVAGSNAWFARGDVSRETSPPPLSLKCRLYADRPHQPCSGTTDDGTNRSCTCICHVPTGYLGIYRIPFPYVTTNLNRDPDDPYDPDDDPPFTVVDGPSDGSPTS